MHLLPMTLSQKLLNKSIKKTKEHMLKNQSWQVSDFTVLAMVSFAPSWTNSVADVG